MREQLVLRIVSKCIIPFILMFGFYVQLHGEYSPGGGFQAGVILASAFILHALVFGVNCTLEVFPMAWMKALSALGVLLYGGVGVLALFKGGDFLNYSVLLPDPVAGQRIGIMVIEMGVGITVCAVMLVLFFTFATYRSEDH